MQRLWLTFTFIALCTVQAAAATPLALGFAILNQDPSIRALTVPAQEKATLAGNAIGSIPEIGTAMTRIRKSYAAGAELSVEQMYSIARSATPAILIELKKRNLIEQAKKVAAVYGVDPVNLIAPIVTEAVFNPYSLKNRTQNVAASLMSLVGYNSKVAEILYQAQTSHCRSLPNSYVRLNCAKISISPVILIQTGVFKDPSLQTYGIGQFSPLRAMMLSDLMFYVSGFKKFDEKNLSAAFAIVLDDDKVLHAIAANTVMEIAAYQRIAGIDISHRPDLIATLYNIGNEVRNATSLRFVREMNPSAQPRNNYFGRYVFEVEDLLRAAVR